jgi:RNA polymerase sigma-70 factor (ECF subfamily)
MMKRVDMSLTGKRSDPASLAAKDSAADAEALVRMRDGDRGAFAELVQRHAGALLRVARSVVKDTSVAEELVQDTWLAALRGLDGFEGRASFRTWLLRILVNRARTRMVRDARTVPFSALSLPGETEDPAVDSARFDENGNWGIAPVPWSEENPERLAERAETRAALEAAISDLPEAQRAVITLRDIEGLETEEICNLLAISVTNQRVLLHRARTKVRRALERHLGGAP